MCTIRYIPAWSMIATSIRIPESPRCYPPSFIPNIMQAKKAQALEYNAVILWAVGHWDLKECYIAALRHQLECNSQYCTLTTGVGLQTNCTATRCSHRRWARVTATLGNWPFSYCIKLSHMKYVCIVTDLGNVMYSASDTCLIHIYTRIQLRNLD